MSRTYSRSYSLGSHSHVSQYEYKDFPPFSQRSRSTFDGGFSDDEGLEASPQLPEAIIAIRKQVKAGDKRASETVIVDEVPVAFVKPEVQARKFIWIHLAYNNPAWVTVRLVGFPIDAPF